MNQDLTTKVTDVDIALQQKMNTPPVDPAGFGPGEKEFIDLVMGLIRDSKINLLAPDTLINKEAYDRASELTQGKADMTAINFASKLRDIRDLMGATPGSATYQIIHLVREFKFRKEEFETSYGDLFVI